MKAGVLFVAILVVAMVVGTPAYAGDLGNPAQALSSMSPAQLEKAKQAYLEDLASKNEGVVQTAIGIILQWRLVAPQEDLDQLVKKINDLAINGSSSGIRFKASLASLAIDNPSVITFDVAGCDDCVQLFDAITGSVRQMVVGHSL